MTTANPIVQRVIESSEKFKNKKIFIMAEYEDSMPAPEVKAAPAPKVDIKKARKAAKAAVRVNEEVRTHADAVTVLMAEGDVNIADLSDVAACIKKAEELGMSFPNLTE